MRHRVTGLGGLFFKSNDPEALKRWYRDRLGIEFDRHGSVFVWKDVEAPHEEHITVWGPFTRDTTYFVPSTREFMINYRVDDLEGILEQLRKEGVTVVGAVEEYEYGKFGWILDPDGTKIELWEPVDRPLLEHWRNRARGDADEGGGD